MAAETTTQVVNGATVTTTTWDTRGSHQRNPFRRLCTDAELAKRWEQTFGHGPSDSVQLCDTGLPVRIVNVLYDRVLEIRKAHGAIRAEPTVGDVREMERFGLLRQCKGVGVVTIIELEELGILPADFRQTEEGEETW